jgi:hypothetical protein
MLSKSKIAELEKLRRDLIDEGRDVPLGIGDISPFPASNFDGFKIGLRTGKLKIYRFSAAMDATVLKLFTTHGASLISTIGLLIFLGIPFVALSLGFIYSWWWLAILPMSLVGMRVSKAAYDSAVLRAALSSEIAFCLLYWMKQVGVWDMGTNINYYRKTLQPEPPREPSSPASPLRNAPALKVWNDPDEIDDWPEEPDSYHDTLDELVADCVDFFERKNLKGRWGWPLALHAEMMVYAACCVAKLESTRAFSTGGWNSFKHSVENRMLAIQEVPDSGSGIPFDGKTLVSYVSGYFSYLDQRECLAEADPAECDELVDLLMDDVGAWDVRLAFYEIFLTQVSAAKNEVIPRAWKVFED